MPLIAEDAPLTELCGRMPLTVPATGGRAQPRPSAPQSVVSSSLERVLADRRSVRRFADRPVPAAVLAAACHTGIVTEQEYWPAETHGDAGLGIAVAAADVHGLATGIHAFSAGTDGFGWLGGRALVGELQRIYVDSPALVLVYADLDRARDTSHVSYQNLLVRAAAAGQATLLNAMGSGLSGCPFGRAASQVSALLSASHLGRVNQLFAIAIGWPIASHSAGPRPARQASTSGEQVWPASSG
jgi:hypothetical protein